MIYKVKKKKIKVLKEPFKAVDISVLEPITSVTACCLSSFRVTSVYGAEDRTV